MTLFELCDTLRIESNDLTHAKKHEKECISRSLDSPTMPSSGARSRTDPAQPEEPTYVITEQFPGVDQPATALRRSLPRVRAAAQGGAGSLYPTASHLLDHSLRRRGEGCRRRGRLGDLDRGRGPPAAAHPRRSRHHHGWRGDARRLAHRRRQDSPPPALSRRCPRR